MTVDQKLLGERVNTVNDFCSKYPGESRALLIYTNHKRHIVSEPYDSVSKFQKIMLNWIGDDKLMYMMHTLIQERRSRDSFMQWCFEKHFND